MHGNPYSEKKNIPKLNSSTDKILTLLIIDDRPLTCKGYEMALVSAFEKDVSRKIQVTFAHSAQEAIELFNSNKKKASFYTIVFLDIRLSSYPEKNMYDREDLGRFIRKQSEKTKIPVLMGLNDHHRLQSVLKSLNPDGLVLKGVICEKNLILALHKILDGMPYYAPTVLRNITDQFILHNEVTRIERKLLHLLSVGIHSKEIQNHLPRSVSKVEKQKGILKENWGLKKKVHGAC